MFDCRYRGRSGSDPLEERPVAVLMNEIQHL
jgi:hypothetical protein